MTTKTKNELTALLQLYKFVNGKYPINPEEINLDTFDLPEALFKLSKYMGVNNQIYINLEHLLSYLGKHIQDCYNFKDNECEN